MQIALTVREFIRVEVSDDSSQECARQLATHCDTTFDPILIDVAQPEAALQRIDGPWDAFCAATSLSSSPARPYGEQVLRIARQLLDPGGLASIQKDSARRRRSRPSAPPERWADLTALLAETDLLRWGTYRPAPSRGSRDQQMRRDVARTDGPATAHARRAVRRHGRSAEA